MWVNRVPGNIHLWTYSHAYLFNSLCPETQGINVSHHLDHVSFGMGTVISFVKEHFAGTGIVSPLDGVHQVVEQCTTTTTTPSARRLYGSVGRGLGQASGGIFEYNTKVVPTTYVPLYGDPLHVHQFTANSNKITSGRTPTIYRRYDFAPPCNALRPRHHQAQSERQVNIATKRFQCSSFHFFVMPTLSMHLNEHAEQSCRRAHVPIRICKLGLSPLDTSRSVHADTHNIRGHRTDCQPSSRWLD